MATPDKTPFAASKAESFTHQGLPRIAEIWQQFETNSTIYYPSEVFKSTPDSNNTANTSAAILTPYFLGLCLSPLDSSFPTPYYSHRPPYIPSYNVEVDPYMFEVSPKPLIIVGDPHQFGPQFMTETIGPAITSLGNFHLLDKTQLLQKDTGRIWTQRGKKDITDYGVIRLFQQPSTNRPIINFAGLGEFGTLGAVMAITDVNQQAISIINSQLPLIDEFKSGLTEILVETNYASWKKNHQNPVADPEQITLQIKEVSLSSETSFPALQFLSNNSINISTSDNPIQLSPLEFSVLQTIAHHSNTNPSFHQDENGYITYPEIAKSINTDIATVRSSVLTLTRKIEKNWGLDHPNLIIKTPLPLPSPSRRKGPRSIGLKLRTASQFNF